MEQNSSFNEIRCGRFTSSEIWKLCTNGRNKTDIGKPFYTYCNQKAAEKLFGFSKNGGSSIETDYGHLAERYIGEELSKEGYTYGFSDIPLTHPNNEFSNYWSGSPDMLYSDCVWDIKSPLAPERIMTLVGCTEESLRQDKPEYFYQLVSNSILTNKKYAGLIVFIPTKEDLDKMLAMNRDDIISYRIEYADQESFPCLPEDKEHFRIYKLKWEVKQEDKEFLIQRVRLAIKECEKLISDKLKQINNE